MRMMQTGGWFTEPNRLLNEPHLPEHPALQYCRDAGEVCKMQTS